MKKINIHFLLLIISVSVYLFTHLYKIEDFPIYFFPDEAMLPVRAEQIMDNKFKDEEGTLLPLFVTTQKSQPALVMYLQMPFTSLFGKQIWVIRSVNVLLTLMGSIFVALILKNIFQLKNYWSAILFLSSIPLFFIHSRAEFNTGVATSFYAGSLYFYYLYRCKNPKFLLLSVVFFALAFYCYFGIWVTLFATYGLLILYDLPYHLKNLKLSILALILALLLLTPYARYQIKHINQTARMIKEYDWNIAKEIKSLAIFGRLKDNYLMSVNPAFLFESNNQYSVRHSIKGYGYFPILSLPLIILGLIYLLANIRSFQYRILLIILLASPLGGVLVGPGATRIMPMIVPLTIIFSLGIKLVEGVWKNSLTSSFVIFAALFAFSCYITNISLVNGPYWSSDYGLYGMQFGAKQIFQTAIPKFLRKNPGAVLVVSPNWSNGVDALRDFFLSDKERDAVEIGSIDYYLEYLREIPDNLVLVMTPEDLLLADQSKKFKPPNIVGTVPYPDGRTGFYFVKISYVADIEKIFEEELRKRRELVSSQILLNQKAVKIIHSKFDAGEAQNIFDHNPDTLARGWEANPLIVELYLAKPVIIKSIAANVGIAPNLTVNLKLFPTLTSEPEIYEQVFRNNKDKSVLTFDFKNKPVAAEKIRFEFKDEFADLAKIHLFEIEIN